MPHLAWHSEPTTLDQPLALLSLTAYISMGMNISEWVLFFSVIHTHHSLQLLYMYVYIYIYIYFFLIVK